MMHRCCRQITKSVDDIKQETGTDETQETLRSRGLWKAAQTQDAYDTLRKQGFVVDFEVSETGIVHEFCRQIEKALVDFRRWLRSQQWRGKEHDCVNLYVHGFLFPTIATNQPADPSSLPGVYRVWRPAADGCRRSSIGTKRHCGLA
jgi:hypothetical protein